MTARKPSKRPARRRKSLKRPSAPNSGAPPAFIVPGRRNSLTPVLIKEISDRVAAMNSFKDACLLSGVVPRTGHQFQQDFLPFAIESR